MRQLVQLPYDDNDLVPCHLKGRETMPEREKVSKCFFQDCVDWHN